MQKLYLSLHGTFSCYNLPSFFQIALNVASYGGNSILPQYRLIIPIKSRMTTGLFIMRSAMMKSKMTKNRILVTMTSRLPEYASVPP